MALLDRIFRDLQNPSVTRISVHRLASMVHFVTRGIITANTAKTRLGFDASDDTQWSELASYYQGLTASQKQEFFGDFEAATLAAAAGDITRTEFANYFGITQ